eukprot:scaffold21728_cov22-Tisochrysis_lutea.AAC.2
MQPVCMLSYGSMLAVPNFNKVSTLCACPPLFVLFFSHSFGCAVAVVSTLLRLTAVLFVLIGAFSLSDLSEDLLGSRSSLGEFESEVDVGFGSGSGSLLQAGQCAEDGVEMPDGGDDDLKGDGDREEDREGDNVGDSWMADFVSDLGFWLECIDMLDEQHAAAAGDRGSNRSSPSGRQARGLNGKALQEGRSWTFAFVWVGNAPGGTCLSILCLGERQGTCSRTDMTSRLPSRLLPEEEGRVLQKDCCSCSVHVLSQAGGFELCCHRCNRCSASCPHGAHLLPSKGPPVFIAC